MADAVARPPTSAAYRRAAADVAIQAALGRFFAHKLRAGVLWEIHAMSDDAAAASAALSSYQRARSAWVEVVQAGQVYVADITFGSEPWLRGHWSDRLSAIDADIAQMAQKNMLFAPDLIAVHTGGAVEFPNLDDTYHNVFSYSKAKRFDLGRYRKNEKPGSVIFDKPGVVTVHCEIHDRMRGTVLVLESPYFQKTDTAGHYRLDHLPPGHFTVKAWINEADIREHAVDLKNGARVQLNFPAK